MSDWDINLMIKVGVWIFLLIGITAVLVHVAPSFMEGFGGGGGTFESFGRFF